MGAGGEGRGGDVPSRRFSPFTLLSYKWGYYSRWPQGRRGEVFFFFSPAFLLTSWEARGEGWWKIGTTGKGKAEGGRVALTR